MVKFILKYKVRIIGVVLGALAGFLYWRFIGCSSGTCPITSKWTNSTLYGMLIGYLFSSSFSDKKKKTDRTSENIS